MKKAPLTAAIMLFVFAASMLSAAEETKGKDQASPPIKAPKDMSKEELVAGMARMIQMNPKLASAVAGLEALKDDKGNVTFMYNTQDGKRVRLEEIDKATVEAMYMRMSSELSRINTERTMKQMQDIRRIQDMERQRRALQQLRTPAIPKASSATTAPRSYTPPKVYTPPKIPSPSGTRR